MENEIRQAYETGRISSGETAGDALITEHRSLTRYPEMLTDLF
jgi:hypothetical protein